LHISSAFNPRNATITLKGSCTTTNLEKGKTLLKNLIAESRSISLSNEDTSTKNYSDRKGFHQRVSMHPQPKMLALDPKEDAEAIKLWNMEIEPILPAIVQEAGVEGAYSVILIRQSSIDGPQPIIRFRSSDNQGTLSRQVIQDRVREICERYGHPILKVQFTAGTLVRLVGGNSSEEVLDDPSNDERFPHQRRYCERPGPGASIGRINCPHVSATMGGHISMDGRTHMLSVDHFIAACTCQSPKVRSPSISDINDIQLHLSRMRNNLELRISRIADHEIPLDQVDTLFPLDVQEELAQYERFVEEVKQHEHAFSLGIIRKRSGEDRSRSSVNSGRPNVIHRLDYSLTEITEKNRQGKNILRHGLTADPSLDDLQNEVITPDGSGDPITTTSHVFGGENVFYVGTTSGLRKGTVSPILMLYRDKYGVESREWAIVVPGCENLSAYDFQGDSGAWIIKDDNSLLGLLWGWDNGYLLFTPIHDVFEDIKERWKYRQVELPNLSSGSRPQQSGILLCRTSDYPTLDDCEDSRSPPINILKTPATGLSPLDIDKEVWRRRGSSASSGSSMSSTPGSVSSSASSFTEVSPPTPEGPIPLDRTKGLCETLQLAFRTKPPSQFEPIERNWEIVQHEIPDIALSPAAVQSAGE
jgi:hypothetical protein